MPGLTPAQISKAVGKTPPRPKPKTPPRAKKSGRPKTQTRVRQNGDTGLLLSLPFSGAHAATQYPTPDWFTATQRADVSVVVPLLGGGADNLIQSWDAATDGLRVEVVFVEDGGATAKDAVVAAWAARRDDLRGPVGRVYLGGPRQGWPACCNIGAAKATGEVLVFLHPDTIVTEGWLRPLVRAARRQRVVGAVCLGPDARTVGDAGGVWDWAAAQFAGVGTDVFDGAALPTPFVIDNAPASLLALSPREKVGSYCMAVSRQWFLEAGGFSPVLTSPEWADADLCLKAREAGLSVACQGATQVYRAAVPASPRQDGCGRVYFDNKWVASGRIDPLVAAKRPAPRPEIRSVVVRRRAAHGDVLVAAAVAPALKKKYPHAQLTFQTDCPEVVRGNPHIDRVVETLSERWFDLFLDLDMVYEYRPHANMLHAYAEACGVDPAACSPHLAAEPVADLPARYAVVHAGRTAWVGRNWSTLKFDQLATRIAAAGVAVVCVGTGADHKTAACDLDLRGKTTAPQLAGVIAGAAAFAGIDSFPMHVAQAVGTPGACFFGAVRPETRLLPWGRVTPVVAAGVACLGCHHRKPTPCTVTAVCEVGVQDCSNGVTVEQMWRAVEPNLGLITNT
jgi:ADP-heptose:LPS heptosyltransferase/GT2 family glycosyltransferase